MDATDRRAKAREIMDVFARSTGLASDEPPRRYLWTDAFAVCNHLGLHAATGAAQDLERARALVDAVHRALGRHRPDDPRSGWISALDEEEGARHPTVRGLRIGKAEPERGPREPFDPHREWDRDGQYYHYLTRWMHALERMFRVTGERAFHRWAVELAKTAHAAFVVPAGSGGGRRMVWKMSIDLSRPLVASMGAHDPLDGLVTLSALAASGHEDGTPPLDREIAELADMCRSLRWVTDDPLGIGGLLMDTFGVARLLSAGRRMVTPGGTPPGEWFASLLDQSADSLAAWLGTDPLSLPAEARLPFRELGLAIGLAGMKRLAHTGGGGSTLPARVERLAERADVADRIVHFWLDTSHRGPTWTDHLDINRVMLASALVPEGVLGV